MLKNKSEPANLLEYVGEGGLVVKAQDRKLAHLCLIPLSTTDFLCDESKVI